MRLHTGSAVCRLRALISIRPAGGTVPLDPVNNRIFVQFVESTGVVLGSSSVAIAIQ